MNKPTTFKRLDVGARFASNQNGSKGQTFRKIGAQRAVRILESGRGDTARPVTFSRSHSVLV